MKKRNIFWGVVFLVIAACILITELGYFPGMFATSTQSCSH